MFHRSSGVLMHITSLPSPHGIGTMGQEAYRFVDFLTKARQTYWQMLPLGHTGYGASPYQCFSAAAGNPLLIDLDTLFVEGLLTEEELQQADAVCVSSPEHISFAEVESIRLPILHQAFTRIDDTMRESIAAFVEKNQDWLPDYALFMALKERFSHKPLWEWPDVDVIRREPNTLEKYQKRLQERIAFYEFIQYIFFTQWSALRQYANAQGIQIIGDIPIYVAPDSCDVWTHPELFQLSSNRAPRQIAGVPPDYFSKTGQLWGNPVYNWKAHEKQNFAWWIWRVRSNLALFDVVRIDHFRGLESYWSVQAGAKTAEHGTWCKGPGMKLLHAIHKALGDIPLIAEDLGVQTDAVRTLLRKSGYPGMKVLIFGLTPDEDNEHLPHNYPKNSIVYTSTHDSQTVQQQYDDICTPRERAFADAYFLGSDKESIGMRAIRTVWASHADVAMTAMQDILSLGAESRMNLPATMGGNNWCWRMQANALTPELAAKLRQITELYKRAAPVHPIRPITHVIFDLDGTLLNTLGDLTHAVNAGLQEMGYPAHTQEEIRCFVGNGVHKLIERAIPEDCTKEQIELCLWYFREYYDAHLTVDTLPYDGVPELLMMLQSMRIRCGVISNKYDAATKQLCAHYFGKTVDMALGERPHIPRKPDPTAVLELMDAMGAKPEHTIYVGDSAVDMQTAQAAGLYAVGVSWGFSDRAVLEKAGASKIIDTPAELLKFLK